MWWLGWWLEFNWGIEIELAEPIEDDNGNTVYDAG